MVALSVPHSLKLLHTNANHHNLLLSRVSSSATVNTTLHFQLNQRRLINNSFWKTLPNEYLIADQKRGEIEKVNKQEEEKQEEEEEVIASVVNRLTAVVERLREREIQKFMSKVKGEISYEERVVLAEEASREIVNKFLEKPIMYLTNCDGCQTTLEMKLKDVEFLLGVLENSCPLNQR